MREHQKGGTIHITQESCAMLVQGKPTMTATLTNDLKGPIRHHRRIDSAVSLSEAGWRTGWATTVDAVETLIAELAPTALSAEGVALSAIQATVDADIDAAFSLMVIETGTF